MSIAEHLSNKLKNCSQYELTEADNGYIKQNGINAFIFKQACSKKFRKWKASDEAKAQISEAINDKVKNNEPIEFTIGFGGYKLWRIPSTPEIDWAEFFTIAYFSEYLAPIAAAYEPGVNLTFADDDAIIEKMNNVPVQDTETYFQSFQSLLTEFSKYWPENFSIKIMRTKDLYGDEYDSALAENIEKVSANFDQRAPEQVQELKQQAAINIQWAGAEPWDELNETEKDEKLKHSLILHEAHCSLPRKVGFIEGQDKVYLTTFQESGSIAIGTTKSCAAKFWTGFGVLEQRQKKIYDIILTAAQLERIKDIEYETEKIDLLPQKNLQEIRIYIKK